ncbi:hypothetical protein CHELA20_40383 [Hyphomicrobiales bacterium]|nr:hypothetical protein CHELA20_40383 [Hyphomicrobiales bacterium]CAH1688436.1 hypothetical protein CHELA41_40240 [Hyphomicrobiales bacterium]
MLCRIRLTGIFVLGCYRITKPDSHWSGPAFNSADSLSQLRTDLRLPYGSRTLDAVLSRVLTQFMASHFSKLICLR